MRYVSVKDFDRFQHYKDRSPPWIKLYNDLLDNYEFGLLPDASKMHLVAIWLLASRYNNRIPGDARWIGQRINATDKVNLGLLIQTGFLVEEQESSNSLAVRKQDACLETETEGETEGETEERKSLSGRPDVVILADQRNKQTRQQAIELLEFLNAKTAKHFRAVPANLDPLIARIRESSADDVRCVIAKKCREWSADDKMAPYLRPATLFNKTKFAQYLGEIPPEQEVTNG